MIVDWVPIAVAILGSVGGGFLGVKIAVIRLETQMTYVLDEIQALRDAKHYQANMIQNHEARLTFLEQE